MNNKQYKVLDLFSGAGGFSYGFKTLKSSGHNPFMIAGAVEIEKQAAETFISSLVRGGMKRDEADKVVISDDIIKKETKKKLYQVCPQADIIIGGPPCQSFSLIGPRSGDLDRKTRFSNDYRDNLFNDYVEIVDYYKPKFFVFENVKGISSKKDTLNNKYIDIIADSFEKIGYHLGFKNSRYKYLLLNTAEYGVPQLRERFILIGNNIGIDNPIPEKTHCPPDKVNETGLKPYLNVRAAIGDLPFLKPKITFTRLDKNSHFNSQEWIDQIKLLNAKRFNGEDPTAYHWELFRSHYHNCFYSEKEFLDFVKPKYNSAMLTGHIARSHQLSDIVLFKGIPEGHSSADLINSEDPKLAGLTNQIKYNMDSFKDKYKKMAWDKPSLTIFAHLQKDGNRFIHPDSRQTRTVTVREAARLQSFPDDYEFMAKGNVRFRYIGNAVPPILARAIAQAIYDSLRAYQ